MQITMQIRIGIVSYIFINNISANKIKKIRPGSHGSKHCNPAIPALQKTLEGILQTKEKNKSMRPQDRIGCAWVIAKQEGRGKKTERRGWQPPIGAF